MDGKIMWRFALFSWLLVLSSLAVGAQAQTEATGARGIVSAPASSVVTFTLDFPGGQPDHYSIRVPGTGDAHYESSAQFNSGSDVVDNFDFAFAISPETRTRIFALTAKAGYFEKDLDAHRKNVAFTGKKILRYTDASRSSEAVYNYSSDSAVEELTTLFQNLSSTLEFGHRLDYDRRYQKLALNEDLKRMQEMGANSLLTDVNAIQPILEKIVADQSIINVARARAQRLLKDSGGR
ncbi:MAG: hypothetical protein WBS24_16990 [Terriglobales bacterium]